jgi:biotin synthase
MKEKAVTRHDWTREEIQELYNLPFPELLYRAQTVHRANFSPYEVQRSTLLSIKTGGCPENCKYCPQSAHYDTGVQKEKLLPNEYVVTQAKKAQSEGSTRFCMGAAWREVKDGPEFDRLLSIVGDVKNLGMEVCCTLGMLTADQASRLKDAGCYAYNHNLDTSPEFYPEIITTRTYQDRLETLKNVRAAGMTVCCGGIIGLGEKVSDRVGLLHELATMNPHPESVPVNMLVQVEGTPAAGQAPVDPIDFVKIIALARIIMPKSFVRLSAGRMEMTEELQALCFLAGANSMFAGEKLLTTPNPSADTDRALLTKLGMKYLDSVQAIQ